MAIIVSITIIVVLNALVVLDILTPTSELHQFELKLFCVCNVLHNVKSSFFLR